jgi:hypothetical protein
MRRIGLALVALLFMPIPANGQVNLGLFGGVNQSNLAGDRPPGASHESRTGLAAGLIGEFHLADGVWLSFQPMYLQRGTDVLFRVPGDTSPDTASLTLALDYVTLPVMVKFVSGNGKTYVAGGIDLGYLANAELSGADESEDVKQAYNDFGLAANFAFGAMLPIGRPRLTLEARYSQSILNVNDPDGEVLEELPLRSRSSGLQLYAGLLYPLGREPERRRAPSAAAGGEPKRPRLAEHMFLTNNLVRDPFIKTFVRNSLGIGRAVDVEIPIIQFDTSTVVGTTGDLVFAFLDFEYQHAVRDWLAARGEVRVLGRLGTDAGALLADGVTAVTAFEFGWLVRLLQGRRTLLSADVKVSNNNTTAVNLLQFVDDVIAGRPARIVRQTPSLRGGGGLRFAWGATPFFGLTALGEVGYGESADRTADDQAYFQLGGTLDFDFSKISPAPIGVVLGGKVDTFPEGGEDFTNELLSALLRVAYNGRADFVVALDFTFEQFDSKALDQTIRLGSTGISMRYFF